MNEKGFSGEIERLRTPERLARMEISRVVDLSIAQIAPRSLLDIGTGSGVFAEAFANRGIHVVGIDVREDMLVAARQYVPDGDFRQGIMEKLPFADSTFDLAFMGMVLHETDDLLTALREAYRSIRKRLAVLEWPYEVGDVGPPIEHRLTTEQITAAAQAVGFARVELIPLKLMSFYRLDK